MGRSLVEKAAVVVAALTVMTGPGDAFAGAVRGKVVKITCSTSRSGYIGCRSRPLPTTMDVTLVEVDGSVSTRSLTTNRSGHFSVKLRSGYYLFAARPPELGMPTEPVEVTIPPQGSTITLKVDVGSL